MSRGAAAAAVIAALLAGLVLGGTPLVRDKLSGILPLHGASSPSTTSTPAATTVTVEKTVTATKTLRKTITKTLTLTQALRYTVTRTQKVTVTTTLTTTVTETITITKTLPTSQSPPSSRWAVSEKVLNELRALATGPPVPVPTAAPRISYGGISVYDGAYLVVTRSHGYPGYYVATIYVEEGDSFAYLVPCCIPAQGMLPPDLLYANKTFFAEYYSVESLLGFLGPGSYKAYIPINEDNSIACTMVIDQHSVRLKDCAIELTTVHGPKLNGYPSILDAVLGSYSNEALRKVRETILGQAAPKSPDQLAWSILAWVGSHISYDYGKEAERNPAVYSPLQLLEKRKGVCSDYAVLVAAALLAGGSKTAYILVLATEPIPHAAAAARINETLFVLDQHLPPIEIGDYVQYILGGQAPQAYMLRIEKTRGGISVKEYPVKLNTSLDTYPEDKIPPRVVEELRQQVARETGENLAPQLATVIEYAHVYTYLDRFLEPLPGITMKTRIPLDALYSPILHREWLDTLAKEAENLVKTYYPGSLGKGSLWLELTRANNATRIITYATPFKEPRVAIAGTETSLVISIETSQELNPYTDIQLIIYSDKEPCAAIAPPSYSYSSIPYTTATKWVKNGDTITIEVDKQRLASITKDCKNPVLGIWMKQAMIYAKPLTERN